MAERMRKRAAGGTSHALCHARAALPRPEMGGGPAADRVAGEADEGASGRPGSTRVGARFEWQARRFLERRQLAFVAANLVVRGGELDLVMRERDGTLVFVEVRARRHGRHGGALASIGPHKRRRLVAAAHVVWARFGGCCACRFDVVAFEAGRLVWLRDAFRADDV
ncbi:YraN family protein [Burkholderia sp. Ac-20379]|uniref:YraN family protein n=1 Tax=Burkholderia sp. Ac-20379 TaxID=2703900 RepID=UPI00197FB517|nr:YraN family protein [Burkholderia sp. Ac-20379]MBN3723484.1 YraN family protein [Burkholderia sp. Ac-20379]